MLFLGFILYTLSSVFSFLHGRNGITLFIYLLIFLLSNLIGRIITPYIYSKLFKTKGNNQALEIIFCIGIIVLFISIVGCIL